MTKVCGICETAEATAIKIETEIECDETGTETTHPVILLICPACADAYYDGTEDYPGTRALAA